MAARVGKRRPALDAAQMAFTFAVPAMPRQDGELAGLGRFISSGVARMLKEDARSREEIAGHMSALLGETVTRWMLDAYASEARAEHSVSAERLLALVVATARYDVLDAIVRRTGAAVLVGDEVEAARLGHLMAQQRSLAAQIAAARARATPIARGVRA